MSRVPGLYGSGKRVCTATEVETRKADIEKDVCGP